MEATELDLGDDGVEIDGVVIYFVSISGGAALAEPNLEARIDGEKEFRVELFVGDFSRPESRSVGIYHRLEGAEALGSNAEFSEEDSAMVNSTRIRVGRNLAGFPLGPGVSKE